MHVKYCDLNSPVTCLSVSTLGTFPSLFLVCIGLWALTNVSRATQNKNLPSLTIVHLIKLTLLAILTVTPIVIMIAYALSSVMILELVYFLYYGFSATNWLINMYILRKEYKKVGYTSAYLRAFWIIELFFQAIFLYLIIYELDTPMKQYTIQNYCRTGSLLLLVIFSCFKVKDSPNAVIEDYTGEYVRASAGGASRRSNLLDRFKISLFGRASSVHTNGHKEVSPQEIVIDSINLSPFKRSEYEEIEEIGISGYENVFRNGQITTVFKVLYIMNKGLVQTRRSYSEFYRLYIKIRGRYAGEAFPVFPVKLTERESRTERVLNDRRKKLEDFLKFICMNKFYIPEFFDFLKEEHELPQFINPRPEKDSVQSNSYVSPFLVGNGSGVESRYSSSNNSRKGRQSEKSLSFNQLLDESDAKSFLEDSESSRGTNPKDFF